MRVNFVEVGARLAKRSVLTITFALLNHRQWTVNPHEECRVTTTAIKLS